MGDEPKPDQREKTPYEVLMRRIAAYVLAVGLSASAVVFALAPAAPEGDEAGVSVASIGNSKRYQLELERIGGKAAVMAVEFEDWFDSLWHGRRLAGTVAVLAALGSWLCFIAARFPPPDDGN